MPHPEAYRFGCDPEETQRNYYTSFLSLFLPTVGTLSWKRISAIPARRGTKEKSNTSNFSDGNGAPLPPPILSPALARSRLVWESRLWVQRFAIITFRACRFVCINSVRQFPLCGVHGAACANASPFSLPALPPFLGISARSVPFRSRRARSLVEAHHAYASSLPFLSRLCLCSVLSYIRKNERSFPGRTSYPGIGKCLLTFPRSPSSPAPFFFNHAYINCTKSFLKLYKYGSFGTYFCYISLMLYILVFR